MTAHWPAVARRTDDRWGVFCLDCSDQAGEYVYPCARGWDAADRPPAVLVGAASQELPGNDGGAS